jgi:hypothetical protein
MNKMKISFSELNKNKKNLINVVNDIEENDTVTKEPLTKNTLTKNTLTKEPLNNQDTKKDTEEDTEEDTEIDPVKLKKIAEEVQVNVINWAKSDDIVRKKKAEIKEFDTIKAPCEQYILKYMDFCNNGTIDISDGKLKKNKSETMIPLKLDYIKESIEFVIYGNKKEDKKEEDKEDDEKETEEDKKKRIKERLINETKVKQIMDLLENRPKKVNINLKRTFNRPNQKAKTKEKPKPKK